MSTSPYRGRFAPSPSGELHFGTLLAAVGSYLQAKVNQGEWLMRIEDVDTTRRVKGADTALLRALEGFGFAWARRRGLPVAPHLVLRSGTLDACTKRADLPLHLFAQATCR